MDNLRAVFRLIYLVGVVLIGLLLTLLFMWKVRKGIPDSGFQKIRRWWFTAIIRGFGIRINLRGEPTVQSALWVSNHISWADIPVIGSSANLGFLSKAEVKSWPVIGWLIEKGGTLFIARGGKNAANGAAEKISQHILQNDSIVVFPEGTTTNGSNVRRFHARLLAPALDHQLLIQPVAIRYLNTDGNVHNGIPLIDDIPMNQSVWNTLTAKYVTAEITFLAPVESHQFIERKKLAEHLENEIGQIVRQ